MDWSGNWLFDEVSYKMRVQRHFKGESLTEGSHQKSCDVNSILKKFEKHGALTHVNNAEPRYMDCQAVDYQQACTTVVQVEQAFMQLDAEERAKYENNPELWLASQGVVEEDQVGEANELKDHVPEVKEMVEESKEEG